MPYYVSLGKARVKVVWTAPASSSPVTLQQAGVGPWYCNRLESEQGSLCRYSSLYLHRYSSLFLFHVQAAITSGNLQVGVRDVLIPVRSTGWRLVWRRPVGRVCRLHAAVPTTWAAFNLLVPKQWPVLPLVLETPPSCTVNSKRWVIQEFSRRLDLRPGPGSATAAVAHRRASGRPSVGNQWPVGCSWTCESGALVGAVQVNVGAVQAKEAVRASKTKKTRLQRRYRAGRRRSSSSGPQPPGCHHSFILSVGWDLASRLRPWQLPLNEKSKRGVRIILHFKSTLKILLHFKSRQINQIHTKKHKLGQNSCQ